MGYPLTTDNDAFTRYAVGCHLCRTGNIQKRTRPTGPRLFLEVSLLWRQTLLGDQSLIPAMFLASFFLPWMFPCRAIITRCAWGEPAPCMDSVR